MHFTRLRLSGFKSFVDPLELRLEPGLTGIVGPNGCGKSNLVEALRWVMGESSARSMRGSGMDDVIFAGTARRPARNLAEVSLGVEIDNPDLASAFDGAEQLEITRRIEREQGSSYRINGRDVRAKDVQRLFADAATGARSPALVSQGRVSTLISAKPSDRRLILEEAAGISGLHSRRREAEQKLRAAESNLNRLQDILVQLESRMNALKRQARQAERYRNLSGDIRKTEAAMLYREWKTARDDCAALKKSLHEADHALSLWTARATAMEVDQAACAAVLPEKRAAESKAAAEVQRLALERDALEAEEKRRIDRLQQLQAQSAQIKDDIARENEARADAKAALTRLDDERAQLKDAELAQKTAEMDAEARLQKIRAEAQKAEEDHDALSQKLAEARGRRVSLKNDLDNAARHTERLKTDQVAAKNAIDALKNDSGIDGALAEAHKAISIQDAAVRQTAADYDKARESLHRAQEKSDHARAELSRHRSALAAIEADIAALESRLRTKDHGDAPPIAESVSVQAGHELALGAALGDDLDAPADKGSPVHWLNLPPLDNPPALPQGATPLSTVVDGPDALTRRLSMTGLADNLDDALAMAEMLRPGQRLVTPDGAMVRWDGFVSAAGAPSGTAIRLQLKNRLHALRKEQEKAYASTESAKQALDVSLNAVSDASRDLAQVQARQKAADDALATARATLAKVTADAARNKARHAGLLERLERIETDLADAAGRMDATRAALADLPAIDSLEEDLLSKRRLVDDSRERLGEVRAAHDSLTRMASTRRERLASITVEHDAWALRLKRAIDQLTRLESRQDDTKADIALTDISPQKLDEKRHLLMDALADAQARQAHAADDLAKAETVLADKNKVLKDIQQELGAAREARIRAETAHEAQDTRRRELAQKSGERYRCPPPDLLARIGIEDSDSLPDMDSLKSSLAQARADRDRLGGVNLRADEELNELNEEATHLQTQKRDLETAISRLRHAIGSLNREGRERLLHAFQEVNRHFEDLFQTLFGGGHAYLELVESDDPLDAGIEIMASPPGKRMQILSLLSGGEQALTALSLIFAVFMTNPAPICVLDEVDAPLDEANVERLCDLLDAMIARTNTRFLIITHNEVTMARMNRLFGVTMSERGISQLVSVDLERAETLLAAE